MAELLRPDVFTEEVQSQIQTIEGVGTTTAGFVVIAESGPIDEATLVTSFTEYQRIFGGPFKPSGFTAAYGWWAVRAFFENGGKRAYIVRVQHRNSGAITAVKASAVLDDSQSSPDPSMTFSAKTHGAFGNKFYVGIRANPKASTTLAAATLTTDTTISVNSTYGIKPGTELKITLANGTSPQYKRVIQVIPGNPGTVELESAIGTAYLTGGLVVSDEFDVFVAVGSPTAIKETWKQVQFWPSYSNVANPDSVEARINDQFLGSDYVTVDVDESNTAVYERQPVPTLSGAVLDPEQLTSGADGLGSFADSDVVGSSSIPSGLQSLLTVDNLSMVSAPGFCSAEVYDGLRTFAATKRYVFVNVAMPSGKTATQAVAYRQTTAGLDSERVGVYYPWYYAADPLGSGVNARLLVPPDGAVMGVDARTDVQRGVFKAGAGNGAVVRGAYELERAVSDGERELLNPVGINVLRRKKNVGIIIDGCRTLSSLAEYRYKSVVRTLLFLEESISNGVSWAPHEPNNRQLWDSLRINISAFLLERWREGYLEGGSPSEAFYVRCDSSTNPQTSINEGKVVVLIGVAIVKPAEFVVLRFSQWDGGRVIEELGALA